MIDRKLACYSSRIRCKTIGKGWPSGLRRECVKAIAHLHGQEVLHGGATWDWVLALLDLGETVLINLILVDVEARTSRSDLARRLFRHCLHPVELALVRTKSGDMAWLIAFEARLGVNRRLGAISGGMLSMAIGTFGGGLLGIGTGIPRLSAAC